MKQIFKIFDIFLYIGIFILSIYLMDNKPINKIYKSNFTIFFVWILLLITLISIYNYFKFRMRKQVKTIDKIIDIISFLIGCAMMSGFLLLPIVLISYIIQGLITLFIKSVSFEQVAFIMALIILAIITNYFIYEKEIEVNKKRKEIQKYKIINDRYDDIVGQYNILTNDFKRVKNDIDNVYKKYNNM